MQKGTDIQVMKLKQGPVFCVSLDIPYNAAIYNGKLRA